MSVEGILFCPPWWEEVWGISHLNSPWENSASQHRKPGSMGKPYFPTIMLRQRQICGPGFRYAYICVRAESILPVTTGRWFPRLSKPARVAMRVCPETQCAMRMAPKSRYTAFPTCPMLIQNRINLVSELEMRGGGAGGFGKVPWARFIGGGKPSSVSPIAYLRGRGAK